jgi:hypothetical protein
MTAHELAKVLLAGPDLPVLVPDDVMGNYDWVEADNPSKPKLMKMEQTGPEGPKYPRYVPGPLTNLTALHEEGYVLVLLL